MITQHDESFSDVREQLLEAGISQNGAEQIITLFHNELQQKEDAELDRALGSNRKTEEDEKAYAEKTGRSLAQYRAEAASQLKSEYFS